MRNVVIDKSLPSFLQSPSSSNSEVYLAYCIITIILEKISKESPLKPIAIKVTNETKDFFVDLAKRFNREEPYLTPTLEFIIDIDTKEQDYAILINFLNEIKEEVYQLDEKNEYLQFLKDEIIKGWLQNNGYSGNETKEEKILTIPSNWHWHDREKGIYNFSRPFKQGGLRAKKKIFQALMDSFEETPQVISIKTLQEKTNFNAQRLRIEVKQINENLSKQGFSIKFIPSGLGYYNLVRTINFPLA